MEERRLLVAVALSLLVLTAYSLLFAPPKRPPSPTATPAAREAARPVAEASASPAAAPVPASPAPPAKVVLDAKEKRVEVGAPDYSVAFTNKGARLLSWTLARYRDARGQPEEIVPAASGGVRPLDIETGDPAVDTRLREALYRASSETLTLAAGAKEPQTLRFEFADGEIEAQKTLRFGTKGLVEVTVAVERAGRPLPCRLVWGPGIGNATPEEREVRGYQPPQGVALAGNRVELLVASKLGPTGQSLSAVRWVGVESQYFAALLIPTGGGAGAEIRPACPSRPAGREARGGAGRGGGRDGGPADPPLRGGQGLHGHGPARLRAPAGGPRGGLARPHRGAPHPPPALGAAARGELRAGRSCS